MSEESEAHGNDAAAQEEQRNSDAKRPDGEEDMQPQQSISLP